MRAAWIALAVLAGLAVAVVIGCRAVIEAMAV